MCPFRPATSEPHRQLQEIPLPLGPGRRLSWLQPWEGPSTPRRWGGQGACWGLPARPAVVLWQARLDAAGSPGWLSRPHAAPAKSLREGLCVRSGMLP